MRQADISHTHGHFEAQVDIFHSVVVQFLADLERTFHHARGPVPIAGFAPSGIVHRPDRENGIPGELDHVAAVLVDDPDQLAEIPVKQFGEDFCPRQSAFRQSFGQHGKAGDVGKEHHRPKILRHRRIDGRGVIDHAPLDQAGHVAGEHFCQR